MTEKLYDRSDNNEFRLSKFAWRDRMLEWKTEKGFLTVISLYYLWNFEYYNMKNLKNLGVVKMGQYCLRLTNQWMDY